MNIEQNEEKSQTQGKFVAVRTKIKDVNRYVMCPTDKKVTMQATLRANQYSHWAADIRTRGTIDQNR